MQLSIPKVASEKYEALMNGIATSSQVATIVQLITQLVLGVSAKMTLRVLMSMQLFSFIENLDQQHFNLPTSFVSFNKFMQRAFSMDLVKQYAVDLGK